MAVTARVMAVLVAADWEAAVWVAVERPARADAKAASRAAETEAVARVGTKEAGMGS